jgi:RND family efflux transporter MFP subunit
VTDKPAAAGKAAGDEKPAGPEKATLVPNTPITAPAKPPARRSYAPLLFFIALLGAAASALIYFFGVLPREAARTELDHEQKLNTQRVVIFATARSAEPKSELPLPGTINAFQQASLYARTTGYVKKWNVDIGQTVHANDVLAELDTPEVDQQLNQARATVEQAKASVAIAQVAADRWNGMVAAHAVSQQEADEKNATLNVAKATLDANNADVQRLTDLQNFKQIRAPFSGTITYRNIEVGNLVSAGTGSTTGTTSNTQELFRVAQTDPLRVYVDVPEANAPSIKAGVVAQLHVAAYPDRIFTGQVVRDAGSLNTASRTLRTEIRVANPDGALLPGAYAEVRLQIVDATPTILIPANTLIVNSEGTSVALVESEDGKDKIRILPVKVGRDFGTEVEILQALKAGDRLVANPASDLNSGMVVTAKPLPTLPPTSPATGSQPIPPKS